MDEKIKAFKTANGELTDITMANQAASTADTVAKLVTDFNALLTKLKAVGLMEKDGE